MARKKTQQAPKPQSKSTAKPKAKPLAQADAVSMQDKYPQGMKWHLTFSHDNVVKMFDDSVAKYADKPCIDFYGKKLTYKEVGDLADRAAKGLQKQGILPGDKIGLCMPNSPYYPIMMFAALKTGATVVHYNPTYDDEKLEKLAHDSDTKTIVMLDLKNAGTDEYHAKIKSLLDKGVFKNAVVCPMGKMMPTGLSWGYWLTKQKWMASSGKNMVGFNKLIKNNGKIRPVSIKANDLAMLQYTGGTTGLPKGAMLTQFNLVSNACQIEQFFAKSPQKPDCEILLEPGKECVLGAMPFFHVFGLQIGMITPIKIGAEIAIVPNPRDLGDVLKTVERTKATLFPAVPRLFQGLIEFKDIDKYDISSLKIAVSGGAALPSNVQKSFESFSGCRILQGYGLSETSPVATAEPAYGMNTKGSIGIPMSGTEIRIVDMNDPEKIMPVGERGEICIKGPQVMRGYFLKGHFNDATETAKVMTKDGAFRTGDLGVMDENMITTITGRLKRLIIINGFNVYPDQIEEQIVKHPSVAEC